MRVSGADQRDVGEVSFITALVAGKDGDAQHFGVCANEKVWQAGRPGAALAAVGKMRL